MIPPVRRLQGLSRRAWARGRASLDRLRPLPARRRAAASPGGGARWVVCFYGVERSLAYTAHGILRRILGPLEGWDGPVTVVAHFNQVPRITGAYSREDRVDLSRDRVRLLDPDLLWVEPQSEAAIAGEEGLIRGVPWRPHGIPEAQRPDYRESGVRLLHQLHSLDRVHQLLRLAGLLDADVVAVLRADLRYLDDLDPRWVTERILGDGIDLLTPDWQARGGLNDRFAFLGRRALDPILRRRREVGPFVAERGYIHSEELLAFAARRAGLRTAGLPLRAERVRATGQVVLEDFAPGEGWAAPARP